MFFVYDFFLGCSYLWIFWALGAGLFEFLWTFILLYECSFVFSMGGVVGCLLFSADFFVISLWCF